MIMSELITDVVPLPSSWLPDQVRVLVAVGLEVEQDEEVEVLHPVERTQWSPAKPCRRERALPTWAGRQTNCLDLPPTFDCGSSFYIDPTGTVRKHRSAAEPRSTRPTGRAKKCPRTKPCGGAPRGAARLERPQGPNRLTNSPPVQGRPGSTAHLFTLKQMDRLPDKALRPFSGGCPTRTPSCPAGGRSA